jgi:hypothetical protein
MRDCKRILFYVFVTMVFFAVLLISKYNQLTFPYPWNDEARFFLPSWAFSIDGSLKPAIVNARDGIFWVPHGYYVLFGVLLRVFGRTIEVARSITQILVATAISLAIVAHQRISRSYLAAICTAAILVTPPVILSANEVRMEGVIALFYSLSLLFSSADQEMLTFSCLLLSALFHPALTIAFVFYCASVFAKFAFGKISPSVERLSAPKICKYGFLSLVFAAIVLEGALVARHYETFQRHMAYQANRKLDRDLVQLLGKPQGIILLAESLFVVCSFVLFRIGKISSRSFYRDLLPVMSLPLGLNLYAVLGGEFQYDIYCLSLAPATFVSIAYRVVETVGVKDV